MNSPAFSASCEVYLRWGKWRYGNGACARFLALALDPGAMPFDESLNSDR
jgi:hypothetical protein